MNFDYLSGKDVIVHANFIKLARKIHVISFRGKQALRDEHIYAVTTDEEFSCLSPSTLRS
jgi:hypothetical protein